MWATCSGSRIKMASSCGQIAWPDHILTSQPDSLDSPTDLPTWQPWSNVCQQVPVALAPAPSWLATILVRAHARAHAHGMTWRD